MKAQRLKPQILTRTRYIKGVKDPTPSMLKSGKSNRKLGGLVRKGMWKGLPIFSLTLEERKTCPSHCEQWNTCYGNNMPFAHRYDHDHPWFERTLATNLVQLSQAHEKGFVVRLHVLGDFFSEDYVKFWQAIMVGIPQVHVFGYTHHRHNSPIGRRVNDLNKIFRGRWRVRFSDDRDVSFRSEVVASEQLAGQDGIVCPEQLGLADSCGDCAYCWHSDKPVYFLEH